MAIGLCLISISQAIFAMNNDELLVRYSLTADKCSDTVKKTVDNWMLAVNIGVTAGTTLWANRRWHYNPWKAFTKFGMPYGNVATKVGELFSGLLLKPFASFLHTQHRLFGWKLPLSFSDIRSQKLEAQEKIIEAVRKGNISPHETLDNPTYAHDDFIRKLMMKVVTNKNNKMRTDDDIIPKEEEELAGGYPQEILELFLLLTNPELAEQLGIDKCGHILAYGPPGSGKTFTAKHIPSTAQVAMKAISIGAQVQSKWVGDSARHVKAIFKDANNMIDILVNSMTDEKRTQRAYKQQLVLANAAIQLKIIRSKTRASRLPDTPENAEARRALIQEATNLENQLNEILRGLNQSNQQLIRQNISDDERDRLTQEYIAQRRNLLILAHIDPDQVPTYHPACVVILDEMDSVGNRNDPKIYSDLANTLQEEMDGISKENKKIIVVGMTNRPDAIDPALKRAGRLERQVLINIPATPKERLTFIRCYAGAGNKKGSLSVNQEVRDHEQDIANATNGFSQSDLQQLFRKACGYALQDMRDTANWNDVRDALQDMSEKKTADQQAELTQLLHNEAGNTRPINHSKQRLDLFNYFAGQGRREGVYPVSASVQQQLSDQHVRAELRKTTAFFSPKDVENVFETARNLAMRQRRGKIHWEHLRTAVEDVRNRIIGDPQAQQPNAANVQVEAQAFELEAPQNPAPLPPVAHAVNIEPAIVEPAIPPVPIEAAPEIPAPAGVAPEPPQQPEPAPQQPQPAIAQAQPQPAPAAQPELAPQQPQPAIALAQTAPAGQPKQQEDEPLVDAATHIPVNHEQETDKQFVDPMTTDEDFDQAAANGADSYSGCSIM